MRRARSRRERDLEAELQAYAELSGVPLAEREAIKENVRDTWPGAFFRAIAQDVRFGLRLLRRSPAFTLTAIAVLALGIGANTALFGLVRGVLLAPLPYPQPGRLAVVYVDFAPQNNPHGHMSLMDFEAWRAHNQAFESPAIYQPRSFAVAGAGQPEEAEGARTSASLFAALGIKPLLGRTLDPGDDAAASPPVVVVSQRFWQEQLGGVPAAIGKPIQLDGAPFTVVGVMPAGFHFPDEDSDLWINLRLPPPTRLGPYFYRGVARLKPGVTWEQAQADTNRIGTLQARAHPASYRRLTMPIEPLREAAVGPVRPALMLLWGAVGLVLALAVANVAGLLLARARARATEMAVRVSLGADALRLVRQLLTESLLLAGAGAAVGIGLSAAALAWLRSANPEHLPRIAGARLDPTVLTITAAAAAAAGLLFGLAPALAAVRQANLQQEAKRQSRARSRSALVAGEIALALVLLCGAGLLLRSLARLEQVDDGVHAPPGQILTTVIALSGPKYQPTPAGGDPPAGLAFDRDLLERVRRIPGVSAAALSDALPPFRENDDDTFTIQGQPWIPSNFPSVTDANVTPGYFASLGIPLLAGRDFDDGDVAGAAPVIIIDAAVARHHFTGPDPNTAALGHFIKDAEPSLAGPYARIVGVVGDARYQGLEGSAEAVYRPVAQSFSPATQVILRTALPAAALAPAIRAAAHAFDPSAVVAPAESLQAVEDTGLGPRRFLVVLLSGFALLAVLLAATGIYGLIAFEVGQRRREIGIRIALGATRARVVAGVVASGARLALAGITAGLCGTLLLARLASGLLFQTSATDPLTLATAGLGLTAVAVLACLLPALRAAATSPIASIRSET